MTAAGSGNSASSGWRLVRAGTDAVPAWVRRFFRARRPGGPAGTPAGRPWLPVVLVAVLVLLVGWVGWGTSVLGVREVRTTGLTILTPAQVRQAAAVPAQTPLLRVRTGEVADRVAALPPVEQVRVTRSWPDALTVTVVERTAVAAVPTAEGVVLVDAEGVVFHTVPEPPLDLPVVVVAAPGPDDPATVAALTVLAALTPQLRAELVSLTVAGPASIELSLFSGQVIRWGDETDSEHKALVATALLDQDAEVIDVSAPDVVSLR